jgi:hypothetical protein
MIISALVVAASLLAAPSSTESGIKVGDTQRKASLLQGTALESDYQPSQHSLLRLVDDVRFLRGDSPAPLDHGGGVSSDVRQILALILGFIPGFGLGHLIAKDKNGFILFLIIDVVLYVLWGVTWGLFYPVRLVGGLVWLVVHIFQAIDAYGAAGGERLVQRLRENAIQIASVPGRVIEPVVSMRQFSYQF